MKTFLSFIAFIMVCLMGLIFYEKTIVGNKPNSLIRGDIGGGMTVLPKEKELPQVFHVINQKNSQIRNFACDNINVKVWQEGGMRLKLNASMYYEKESKFRLNLYSVLGKELDIGSNDQQFWFWSKRMKPPSLHFANHEDFCKTRLRTPFNPKWMIESLGIDTITIDTINTANKKIVETPDKYIVYSDHKNSVGKPIVKMTYINKRTNRIDGFMLVDQTNKKVASGEVQAWTGELPQKILYVWFEENTSMLFELSGQKSNVVIDSRYWQMPNISPKTDMSKDR